MKQREITAAIYLRLSRDDGGDSESNSIGTQRDMLQKYAHDNNFIVYNEYVDDGWSGTTFDRPSFKRMIEDIEAGCIGAVLIKDLSRLGRNNALVAFYTEIFFQDKDIRLIAINDSIDTGQGESEIMAFKSVINEYYARDISKKIRSSKRALQNKGCYTGAHAPYGYIKNPANKHHLLIDDEAADVVRIMFAMADEGCNAYTISRKLIERKILTPNAYKAIRHGENIAVYDTVKPYMWQCSTIRNVLKNRVYVGDMVSYKQTTKSFKNAKLVQNPESEWIKVEGTHEGIVDVATYERVQRLIKVKKRENVFRIQNIFVGVLKCFDCGSNLNFLATKQSKNKEGKYMCSQYRLSYAKEKLGSCTIHSIAYRTLYDLTLEQLNIVISANLTEDEVLRRINKHRTEDKTTPKTIQKLKRRENELRQIIRKIVEQNALGQITQDTFAELYNGYQSEQDSVAEKIIALEERLSQSERDKENASLFIEAVRKYTVAKELTAQMIHDLIEKIVVHEANGAQWQHREQTIDFHYRFVGKLD